MRTSSFQCSLLLAVGVLSAAIAKPCTVTTTSYTTVTGEGKQKSTTLPSKTVHFYSSTVLVGTPYHGPTPYVDPSVGAYHCSYRTKEHPISSTPAVATVSAATKCSTTTTTTITLQVDAICTTTQLIYPAPKLVSKSGVLTTKVPSFCAGSSYDSTGEIPEGDQVYYPVYPYFAQTDVECCVACATQYFDLVASAFIPGGLDCQCLVDAAGKYPGKSSFCPHGLQPYAFADQSGDGQTFPGPCRKG